MANLTTRIGGQHYYKAADGNSESLLNFWKGTQTQYDQLKMTTGWDNFWPARLQAGRNTGENPNASPVGGMRMGLCPKIRV